MPDPVMLNVAGGGPAYKSMSLGSAVKVLIKAPHGRPTELPLLTKSLEKLGTGHWSDGLRSNDHTQPTAALATPENSTTKVLKDLTPELLI
jgi:hypothetical protein